MSLAVSVSGPQAPRRAWVISVCTTLAHPAAAAGRDCQPGEGGHLLAAGVIADRAEDRVVGPDALPGACLMIGSVALSVVTLRGLTREGSGGRLKLARPNICRLVIFVLQLTPSVRPLWCGSVSAVVAALMSSSRP